MTDHELLEKAAKAAGIQLADDVDSRIPSGGLWILGRMGRDEVWNPLEDDGDALRLAARLFIQVTPLSHSTTCRTLAVRGINELHGDGPMAATRRAIVRAAAAMGDQS